jgi:hypothetical protein
LLGSIAGFTIFLGLPLTRLQNVISKNGFLNAFAIGILVFLIMDVFGHAWDSESLVFLNKTYVVIYGDCCWTLSVHSSEPPDVITPVQLNSLPADS